MGRPQKDKKLVTDTRINLRPSLPELRVLQANAAKAKLPLSTYVLQAALKMKMQTRSTEKEDISEEEIKILSGIGNNLNQLAKRANQEKSITPVLQEVYILVQQVKARLKGEDASSELESENDLNN